MLSASRIGDERYNSFVINSRVLYKVIVTFVIRPRRAIIRIRRMRRIISGVFTLIRTLSPMRALIFRLLADATVFRRDEATRLIMIRYGFRTVRSRMVRNLPTIITAPEPVFF